MTNTCVYVKRAGQLVRSGEHKKLVERDTELFECSGSMSNNTAAPSTYIETAAAN